MSRKDDEIEIDDIDLDKVIWDARYRRVVIERLNREAEETVADADAPRPRRQERTG